MKHIWIVNNLNGFSEFLIIWENLSGKDREDWIDKPVIEA